MRVPLAIADASPSDAATEIDIPLVDAWYDDPCPMWRAAETVRMHPLGVEYVDSPTAAGKRHIRGEHHCVTVPRDVMAAWRESRKHAASLAQAVGRDINASVATNVLATVVCWLPRLIDAGAVYFTMTDPPAARSRWWATVAAFGAPRPIPAPLGHEERHAR